MNPQFKPNEHHRRSIRLPRYDYVSEGWYFVTLCSLGREHLFGEIAKGAMHLKEAGQIVDEEWRRTAQIRKEIELDAFAVMPDHMHGLVYLRRTMQRTDDISIIPFRSPSVGLGAMVRGFKIATTIRINDLRGERGVSVWQRNYYERIIRNSDELNSVRRYIVDNPSRWRGL